ncbi:MAG: transposase [Candidatus Azotimanducaceae bacterium]|jgi:transposase
MQQHKELKAHDNEKVLCALLKTTHEGVFKTRLKAIIMRKRGSSPQDIAERLLVNDRSVRDWITLYNQGGTPKLTPKSPGRSEGNPKWSTDIFIQLTNEIDTGGCWSIPRMQEWIKDIHKKDIPEQTVWYRMHKLNYSYKSARPHPVQGDKERQETFKKRALLRSWSRI